MNLIRWPRVMGSLICAHCGMQANAGERCNMGCKGYVCDHCFRLSNEQRHCPKAYY